VSGGATISAWSDHPKPFHRDPAERYAHRLVFHRYRGVLVHGQPTDWRARVQRARELFERVELLRRSRYPEGTIPYRRSVSARSPVGGHRGTDR